MDHLPTTLSPKFGSLSIPFLCPEDDWDYSHQPQGWEGFKKFPDLKGFPIQETVVQAIVSRRHAAFLQSWLFFGLLREVFSRPNYCYEPKDFVRFANDGPVITTKPLARYTWYWQAARVHDDGDEMRSLEKTIDKCLGLVHSAMSLAEARLRSLSNTSLNETGWSAQVRVLFSIALLGDYLSTARRRMRLYSGAPRLDWRFAPLEQVMKDAGWCVGEIATLPRRCNLSTRCYLAGMDRTWLKKNHERCNEEMGCLAHQLNYHTYRTSHHWECPQQTCTEIGPPVQDIVSAIRNGGIAVVDASGIANDQHPRIIQFGGTGGVETPFVAISHVWSDGLGNPQGNRLCLCQLRRIQQLVDSLFMPGQGPVPFWIDSLGIPVGKSYVKDRQVAIARIGDTFRKANKVLVLENSLQMCQTGIGLTEILIRIQYSPWMTRVWTLLEGYVAKGLIFQVADRAISSEELNRPNLLNNTEAVSQYLKELSDERLWSCPSAMQLMCALASAGPGDCVERYANMPKQSDAAEEEFRQGAIKILEENKDEYALGEEWRHILSRHGFPYHVTEEDSHVKSDITNQFPCPVFNNPIPFVRGHIGAAFRNGSSRLSILFADAASGLLSRTTSRLDDETICFGAMLGLSLTKIVEIPTMNWRLRELLESVDGQRSTTPMFRSLGINTRRYTETCHLKRMEVLLSQITHFPLSIIFWNIPRLSQHSWAPRSILNRDLEVLFRGVVGFAERGEKSNGLEFTMFGFKLDSPRAHNPSSPSLPPQSPSAPGVNVASRESGLIPWMRRSLGSSWRQLTWIKGLARHPYKMLLPQAGSGPEVSGEVLTIRPKGPTPGDLSVPWLRVRFVADDRTVASARERRRVWTDYFFPGQRQEFAIIFRGDCGTLIRVLGAENGMHIAQHVRLVEVAPGTTPGVEIAGVWIVQGKWCIL
ncbi:hypothetical protein CEP54_014962 [Fusarium duplospermum]|uniref:Heterokaryon incompatibility domain-containing protein n=1 Tax=Fusarium duplospermum TaxID=1325734 RepID=A0A428NSM2_9HYPO|nr:hypothetical protein CEP54_014962 [Fusarium duplospermum]